MCNARPIYTKYIHLNGNPCRDGFASSLSKQVRRFYRAKYRNIRMSALTRKLHQNFIIIFTNYSKPIVPVLRSGQCCKYALLTPTSLPKVKGYPLKTTKSWAISVVLPHLPWLNSTHAEPGLCFASLFRKEGCPMFERMCVFIYSHLTENFKLNLNLSLTLAYIYVHPCNRCSSFRQYWM